MKSCNEMTNSVFQRIEEYKQTKKKRKNLIAKVVVPVLGVCIAVIAVIFAQQPDNVKSTQTEQSELIVSVTDKKENANKITVNEANGLFSKYRMYICLLVDDFVVMEDEELNEYYGTNVFPKVPEDLTEWEIENGTGTHGIYKRNGGTGEVYHDTTVHNYSNKDLKRSVNLEVAKWKYPFSCFAEFEKIEEMSIINNTEVLIGKYNSYYYAKFMYKDVGFQMITEGLSIEEVVNIIESLTK